MEPFSLATGILTSIGAIAVTIEALNSLKEAPDELRELSIQLSTLDVVVTQAVEITQAHDIRHFGHDLLCSVNDRLKSAHSTFESRFVINASRNLLRKRWVTRRKDIKRLSKDIVAIRTDLNTALNLSTLFIVSQNRYTSITGLSVHSLERSSVFHPESYIIEQPLYEHLIVYSMVELHRRETSRVDIYHLLFPTKRQWKRVVVFATTPHALTQSLVSAKMIASYKTLPGLIEPQLEEFLRNLEAFKVVTTLRIQLEVDVQNTIKLDSNSSVISDEFEETPGTDTSKWVEEIRYRNLPQYVESQVVTLGREAQFFYVYVESQVCIECKLPFTGQAVSDVKQVENFVEGMNLLLLVQGCTGIPKFGGVILEDTQLRSYLLHAPYKGRMWALMANGETAGSPVSWIRRERWFRQIIAITADIHKRGVKIGYDATSLNQFWVNADDNIEITALASYVAPTVNYQGFLPPEVRGIVEPGGSVGYNVTMQSDIFNLGIILWRLVQYTSLHGTVFCRWNSCEVDFNHWCTADHTNPVELPPCSGHGIPKYVDTIISHCRRKNPFERTPAAALIQMLPLESSVPNTHTTTEGLLPWQEDGRPPQNISCDKCGRHTVKEHYRCNTCCGGDFDICPTCFAAGIRCLNVEHTLFRRVVRDGAIVNEPPNSNKQVEQPRTI